ISFEAPEFTCLCPMTGQPDFATIRIRYTPDALCVELKSLKLYLWSFRDEGAFHEAVTNRIANDLIALLDPRFLEVEGDFYVRGGNKRGGRAPPAKAGGRGAPATRGSRARQTSRGRSRATR